MTEVRKVRNVNQALCAGMLTLASDNLSSEAQSRNGPVRRAKGPVVFETQKPTERVLFSPMRRANPFFHLMESLWMLGGRNDLPWLAQFNKQMATYSDDGGKTQPAAYGHRWREYFGYDQLDVAVMALTKDPATRRAVIGMWDTGYTDYGEDGHIVSGRAGDLHQAVKGSADVPCNTQIYLTLRTDTEGTRLDMIITCRSNDALWGAHGANAVHFSVLQEYLAARLTHSLQRGVRVGKMTQFANDYHFYTEVLKHPAEKLAIDASDHDYYSQGVVAPLPMFQPGDFPHFESDLATFLEYADPKESPLRSSRGYSAQCHSYRTRSRPELSSQWLKGTAMPMLLAWDAHKSICYGEALEWCHKIEAPDWQRACLDWMQRTADKFIDKEKV